MNESNFKIDFIGIGAMRAATNWLYHSLKEHPEIYMSPKKEIHFFDNSSNFNKGIRVYENFFDEKRENQICGEFTASYLSDKKAPRLIHQFYPDVKLIVSLRNPTDRAFSQYNYNVYREGRLKSYDSFKHAILNDKFLFDKSLYAKHLRNYLKFFGKKKNFGSFF